MNTQRKVFVGVANHYANNDILFISSALMLSAAPPVPFCIEFSTDPSVIRARNNLVSSFLASDCTHLLFVDADLGFTPQDVARISSHNVDLVGGLYPIKEPQPRVRWCVNVLTAPKPEGPDGLREVDYVGTGFMCIARRVFMQLIAQFGPQLEYFVDGPDPKKQWAFFQETVDRSRPRPRLMSEDWFFCQSWLNHGGKVFVDPRVVLQHAGRAVWPLPLQENNPFKEATA